MTIAGRSCLRPRGFWLRLSDGFAHVRTLGDKPEPLVWPDNPFPTVEAVGASGTTLLVSIRSVSGLFVSADTGRRWQRLCQIFSGDTAIAIDGDRLQLRPNTSGRDHACPVPGLKTRVVYELPQESCNGALCVRWRDGRLARTRDRGRSWDDLTDRLPSNAWRERIVAGAAAGREILIGIDPGFPLQPSRLDTGLELVALRRRRRDVRALGRRRDDQRVRARSRGLVPGDGVSRPPACAVRRESALTSVHDTPPATPRPPPQPPVSH